MPFPKARSGAISGAALLACISTGSLAVAAEGVALPAFSVQVRMSAQARSKLDKAGEKVHVAAYYYGVAREDAQSEDGQVAFGSEEKDIMSGDTAKFAGTDVSDKDLAQVEGGVPRLLINVYSARKVFQDNVLDCGIYDDDARTVSKLVIDCKLIGER